jgi:hypothetical protein
MSSGPAVDALLTAMKRAAAALRDHGVDFALAGGLAVYAQGGPESSHDVDFLLRRDDAEQAVEILREVGFRSETPPEGWLFKVFAEDGSMIDLIFSPNNRPQDVEGILERADEREVYAITLKVASVTDVLASKLLVLNEHQVDYEAALAIARACREQIDWDVVRRRTADSPYAKAFLTLVEELGLTRAAD